jgi:peroxiredoxin
VLGVSVDFNDANKAWSEKLGLTYPLMSDMRRQMSRAYEVLFDDAAMATDPKKIPTYLRSKRAWFVLDKEGIIRYTKIATTRDLVPNEELLQVLSTLK